METLNLFSCRSPYLDSDKVYPPLGLLYLKAAVEKDLPNVKVNIVDEYDDSDLERLAKAEWQGISVMTPQRKEATRLRETLRKHNKDTKVIIGGPHVKHYLEDVQKQSWDYIVPHDGQRPLVKILSENANRTESDMMSAKDWALAPRPDRTSPEAREMLGGYKYHLKGKPATTLLTATGCPMQCTFCEDASTSVRWSPLDKIKQELDDIVAMGYKGVYLFDDLFAIAMPKVKPIAEELKKRNLEFRCNGQANFFTKWGEDFAQMLAENGCYEIAFGHETGSQKILDNIKKQTTVQQNLDSTKYAKKYGIKVKSFLMLGLPGEDWETMQETEDFIKASKPDDFQMAIYYPYKGTAIRDAIDRGDNNTDIMFAGEGLGAYGQKGGATESVIRTSALSQEDLLHFRDYLVQQYKPASHRAAWQDKFFDTHLKEEK
jgi:radical SAM superfamily enzyme YgiQ (UPF0313 family)